MMRRGINAFFMLGSVCEVEGRDNYGSGVWGYLSRIDLEEVLSPPTVRLGINEISMNWDC